MMFSLQWFQSRWHYRQDVRRFRERDAMRVCDFPVFCLLAIYACTIYSQSTGLGLSSWAVRTKFTPVKADSDSQDKRALGGHKVDHVLGIGPTESFSFSSASRDVYQDPLRGVQWTTPHYL